MIKQYTKATFEGLDKACLEAKREYTSKKVDLREFFVKYMLDTRLLANYIWEPINPDLESEFDHPIMGIQTMDRQAPYAIIKELDRSFLSIAESFGLSHDFHFAENKDTSFRSKFRLTCDDTYIKISSLESQTDKPICPALKKFIDKQRLAINCDFIRSKHNYLYALEKALEK